MLFITTAGSNVSGPCYSLQLEAQRMLEGVTPDDELFALIYGIDQDDDWTDPEMLRKANPNYGDQRRRRVPARPSPGRDGERQGAGRLPDQAPQSLGRGALCLSSTCRMDRLPARDRAGRLCRTTRAAGFDLASTVDVNAVSILIRDGERYTVFSRFYLPEATVERGHNQHYQTWAREGRLIVTPGEIVDMERIRDDILDLATRFLIDGGRL